MKNEVVLPPPRRDLGASRTIVPKEPLCPLCAVCPAW
jgi:hypothetical protein